MGMSASQARFLALTARKSNVEYQGQQVNQQRTSLANESAGIYRQMLDVVVPTPPSATDYYSLAYTFAGDTGNSECRLMNWTTNANGGVNVQIKKTVEDRGPRDYTLNDDVELKKEKDGTYTLIFYETKTVINEETNKEETIRGDQLYRTTLKYSDTNCEGNKPEGSNGYYAFQKSGRTMFVSSKTLEELMAQATENSSTVSAKGLTCSYFKGEQTVIDQTYYDVEMETDPTTGRFISMTYKPDPENPEPVTVDLTIKEVNDENGYSKALEEYNYKKMLYDRTMDDFNNRTAIIQQQDKKLELALKQLDTEQNAISQEMDAVKSVIKKNVEDTFKTFNA